MISLFVAVALADKPVKIKPADCEPLDEPSFRSFVLDAQAALDRDDAALNGQILVELDERLPCLTFAPAPRVWADLLVSKSIAAFAAQGDWQTPLAAAVRVRPQIDRGVGSAHPIGKWEPPAGEPPLSAGPLPTGVVLWVDGVLATELPPVAGLHLVQRESGGQWVSRVLVNEPIADDWLTGQVVQPLKFVIDAQISGGYEIYSAHQQPNWPSDYVPNGVTGLGGPVLAMRGMVRVREAAVLADVSGRFLSFEPLELGHADFALGARLRPRLVAGLGAGIYNYATFLETSCFGEGCAEATVDWLDAIQVSGLLTWYGRDLDSPVRGGATFSTRGRIWTVSGWWDRRIEGNWFYGLNASVFSLELAQQGSTTRKVNTLGATFALEFGTRFGLDL